MDNLYGIYSQFFRLPEPKGPFTDQTVIVTGSNSGIGVESARHYVNLDAKKLILAVRNIEGGNEVKKSIEETTKRTGVVEVWKLDMSNSASVLIFANRVNKELPRLDVAALNAGVAIFLYKASNEGWEEALQVNVISTAYLAILLLPKLYTTANQYGVTPRLNITSSGVDAHAKVAKDMLVDGKFIEWLNTEEKPYLLDLPNGLRTIVNAGEKNNFQTHGKYLANCEVSLPSEFVRSKEGYEAQISVWNELRGILYEMNPETASIIDSGKVN